MGKNKRLQFEQKIKDYLIKLIPSQKRQILVALSGGPDSIFLAIFLKKLGYNLLAAHVNFQLRGIDSDGDQHFVQDWCQSNGIKLVTKSFDTMTIATRKKLGIEETARHLRYDWFNTICQSKGILTVVTGHQLEDQAESILMNLIRGTGLEGAKGILPISSLPYNSKNYQLVVCRPLLQVSKSEILDYLHQNNIPYRIDLSNADNEFTRNKIRNKIIPITSEINNKSVQHIAEFGFKVQALLPILQEYIEKLKAKHLLSFSDKIQIKVSKSITAFNLFYLLEPFGFKEDIVSQLYKSITSNHKGNTFISTDYIAITGQKVIDIVKRQNQSNVSEEIKTIPFRFIHEGKNIKLYYTFKKQKSTAIISIVDAKKVRLPITLRTWQAGDRMAPLGMHGKSKKIKDMLTDHKVSGADKKKALILVDQSNIIWLAPTNQISDLAKCDEKTKKILVIESY